MLQLYYSPGACSLAPHVVLEEIEVPFEPRPVSLADGEHRTPEYRAINPRERVPALAVDGAVVTEVPALLTYLASLKPEAALIPPPGTLDFARCFEWLAFLSSSLHVAYAQFRRPERFLPPGFADPDAFVEQGRQNTRNFYLEVEGRLSGPWALGKAYSIADAYLLPFYLWAERVGLTMAQDCPRWAAWHGRMSERPAVRRALEREGLLLEPAA